MAQGRRLHSMDAAVGQPLELSKDDHAIGNPRKTAAHAAPGSRRVSRGRRPEASARPAKSSETAPDFDPDESVYDSYVRRSGREAQRARFRSPTRHLHRAIPPRRERPSGHGPDDSLISRPERQDQPGTAEVFRGVGSRSDEIVPPPGRAWLLGYSPASAGCLRRPATRVRLDRRTTDAGTEARGTWMSLVFLSYASAVTLGLVWMLWTGRAFRSAAPTPTARHARADEPAAKTTEPQSARSCLRFRLKTCRTIGKTIRIGEVEITPLAIQLAPVDLVHRIDPAEFHHEEANSLVLRFKLTNLSNVHSLKPLARSLVRDQSSSLDRSFVATPGRRKDRSLSPGRRKRVADPGSGIPGSQTGRERRNRWSPASRSTRIAYPIR